MAEAQVIALDIGGVCLRLRPERCFGLLGYRGAEEIPVELLAAVDRYERGRIDEEAFIGVFRRVTEARIPDPLLLAAWNAILGEEMPGMAETVGALRTAGHRVVLFSDTSVQHMREFRRLYPISRLLPDGVYSFVVGAKKPEPAMYAAFEADYGRPALYIDDRQLCVDGGAAAGWPSWRFTGVDELRAKLRSRGLVAEPSAGSGGAEG